MARAKATKLGRTFRGRQTTAGVIGTSYTRGGWGAKWRIASSFAPSFDAVALVDHISDVVLAEHYHAIGEDRRAEGPQPQRPLASWGKAGKDAAEGRRPNVRGYTGSTSKPFRDNLERTPIKVKARTLNRSRLREGAGALKGQRFRVNETVEATKATTTIRPDPFHESFMGLEVDRKVQYLFVGGYVAEAVDKAIAAYTNIALEGALEKGDKRERKAGKAKTK